MTDIIRIINSGIRHFCEGLSFFLLKRLFESAKSVS